MYYEFTMIYTSGKVSIVSVEAQEYSDQVSYCREGISGGWLISYDYESIRESW